MALFPIILLCLFVSVSSWTVGPLLTLYDQPNYAGNSIQLNIGDNPTFIFQAWFQLNGNLAQVSYDGNQICGCATDQNIWCANFTQYTSPTVTLSWRQVPGALDQVYVYGAFLFGVIGQVVYQGNSQGDPAWTVVVGGLRQIAFDGTNLCGVYADVSVNDPVFCANSSLTTNPNWNMLPLTQNFTYMAVGGGQVYALSNAGSLFYKANIDPNIDWTQIDNGGLILHQISFDGQSLCGTELNGNIWCALINLTTSPNWIQYTAGTGWMNQVVIYGRQLVGINNNNIYNTYLDPWQCIDVPSTFDTHSYDPAGMCIGLSTVCCNCTGGSGSQVDPNYAGRSNLVSPFYPAQSFTSCSSIGLGPAV